MVLKVKEPIASEYGYLRPDLTLFTYLHLAANEPLTRALVESGTTAIAYETVQLADGSLPLLAPMSEVAGRMSTLVGAYHLMSSQGGRGVLASGVPGVRPAKVAVIGCGRRRLGRAWPGRRHGRRRHCARHCPFRDCGNVDDVFRGQVKTVASNPYEVEIACLEADLVIGAVLVAGARAPHLVRHELVAAHEARLRARRHRDRPRRMLRGLAPHHPRGADLPRRGLRVLLRGQHAGRRGEHVDRRALRTRPCRTLLTSRTRAGTRASAAEPRPREGARGGRRPHRQHAHG